MEPTLFITNTLERARGDHLQTHLNTSSLHVSFSGPMDVVTAPRRPSVVYLTICWQRLVEGTMLIFLINCLLTRLPYTLSPYHSSSLYTVSSLVFLIHCLLITRLPYTLSPYRSSSFSTVSVSLVFLIHCLLARLPYTLCPYHSSA